MASAFRALDDAGVRWCLLRPPSNPSAPTGDVDLLVHPDARAAAGRALTRQGFARVPDGGSPDSFFLSYDASTDTWVLLHVTTELSFGRYLQLRTGAGEACLDRRIRRNGIWRLVPEDEFWTTLLHALLDKGVLGQRLRERLLELAPRSGTTGPLARALAVHGGRELSPDRVLDCVRHERWEQLDGLAGMLCRSWRRDGRGAVARTRVRFLWGLLRGLPNPWRRRGLSVALLGPDGAGKSTLAAGLAAGFYFPGRAFYMDVKDAQLAPIARLRVPGLTLFTFLAILWWRLGVARWRQARGELVIFDRYTYDVLTAAKAPATLTGRLARLLHFRLFPRAGMVLVLDVPGAVMFDRKHERSAAELEDERSRLFRIGDVVRDVEVVDATQPAEQVRRDATARIWRRYAVRWGAVLPPEDSR